MPGNAGIIMMSAVTIDSRINSNNRNANVVVAQADGV